MAANAVTPAGGSQPHTNIMPSMAINYIIAVEGIYPTRN
jgi:microcystin-dependent protein